MSQKIVINEKHGGFGLSHEASLRYFELKGVTVYPEECVWADLWTYWLLPEGKRVDVPLSNWNELSMDERIAYNQICSEHTVSLREVARDDPILVRVVEELGETANGKYADLKIVEIPDDVKWQIEEYDGIE